MDTNKHDNGPIDTRTVEGEEFSMDAGKDSEAPKNFVPGPAWRAAEAAGIDMSLIELSLEKTPLKRMQDHDRALAQAKLLREAMRQHYGSA